MRSIPYFSKKRQKQIEDGTLKPWQKKVRRPTGEAALLDRLIKERGPFSEISGADLVGKEHPKYHWQLFHILGKGEYPELRLEDENVILATWQEQDAWTNRKWTLRDKKEWAEVFRTEARLKAARRGVTDTTEHT